MSDDDSLALWLCACSMHGPIRLVTRATRPECENDAPLELLRLNPFARHDIASKPPADPAGAFIWGVRYYAGMLEDGDSWWHSLGHIESLCRDFQAAIDARAGKTVAPSEPKPEALDDKVPCSECGGNGTGADRCDGPGDVYNGC